MRLGEWLKGKGISPTDFGRSIGKPQATISRYVSGQRIPEPETMTQIVEATSGDVTPNDFYGVSAKQAEDAT